MFSFIRALRRIVENPYLNILIGILFLYSGLYEAKKEFEELGHFELGAHHGVALFAALHLLKVLPDLFEGLEYFEKGEEGRKGFEETNKES